MEYTLYEYVRDAYKSINTPLYRPLTEDLIVHLVGGFGLDILKKTKLIEPAENPGQYVLCGYANGL
jgi:hypothetical protein